MKKLIPYVMSILLGGLFGFFVFHDADFNIKEVFEKSLDATAFQLGVFNNKESAFNMQEQYNGSIIMEDDDVYRVYYSILTNQSTINKMEKYLSSQDINYYLKEITITDETLIKALHEYETTMLEGSESVLVSINGLIMSNYNRGV